jgi:hypothetical protein
LSSAPSRHCSCQTPSSASTMSQRHDPITDSPASSPPCMLKPSHLASCRAFLRSRRLCFAGRLRGIALLSFMPACLRVLLFRVQPCRLLTCHQDCCCVTWGKRSTILSR